MPAKAVTAVKLPVKSETPVIQNPFNRIRSCPQQDQSLTNLSVYKQALNNP